MLLSAEEEALIGAVRSLPPEEAAKIVSWARALAGFAQKGNIDWSDDWTDEDLAEATAHCLSRFEAEEREDS